MPIPTNELNLLIGKAINLIKRAQLVYIVRLDKLSEMLYRLV